MHKLTVAKRHAPVRISSNKKYIGGGHKERRNPGVNQSKSRLSREPALSESAAHVVGLAVGPLAVGRHLFDGDELALGRSERELATGGGVIGLGGHRDRVLADVVDGKAELDGEVGGEDAGAERVGR